MDNNSNPQDAQDMQEALEAYQAYKAHKANAQPPSSIHAPQGINPFAAIATNPEGLPSMESARDPNFQKSVLKATSAALLAPAAGAEAAGMGLLGRASVNAGAAGLQKYLSNLIDSKQDRTEGVPGAVGLGGALSVGTDALAGLLGGAARMYRTVKGAVNPAGMQDEAISAVSDATDKLRSSEAQNLKEALTGKSIDLDTTRIRGIHPEIDSVLNKYATPYGDIPSVVKADASDANQIRSILDQEMSYKKLGPFAQSAETAARDAQIKPLADQIRGQVHGVSPEVSDTLDQWSDNLNAARNLDKRAETAPMTVLTSPSIDRRALLQKVDSGVGTSLQDLGHQINDSKNLSNAVHQVQPIKAALTLGKSGVTGLFNGAQDGSVMSNPAVIQSLFGVKNATSER